MATLTSGDIRMNQQQANILEEARNRKIAIQNQQREEKERAVIWRDKQVQQYGKLIQITPTIPLSQIITEENQASSQDEFLQQNHAMANLLTIADQTNTEYILDRLSPEQMRWLNDNWKGFIRDIMKNKSKMDKNAFINEIVTKAGTGGEYQDNTTMVENPAGVPFPPVERPAVAERKVRKQAEYEEVARRGQSEREAYEKEQAEANDRANEYYGKIRAEKDENQRQIRNQAANKIIKNFRFRKTSGSVAAAPVLAGSAGGSPAPSSSAPIRPGASQATPIASAPVGASDLSPVPSRNLFGTIVPPPPNTPSRMNDATKIFSPTPQEKSDYKSDLDQINAILEKQNKNGVEAFLEQIYGKSELEKYKNDIRKNGKKVTVGSLRSIAYHLGLQEIRDGKKPFILLAPKNPLPSSSSGKGFRTVKKVIRGRGYTKNQHPTKKPRRHYINEKFYVDLNKLEDGILVLKYSSNDSSVPHLKTTQIGEEAKEIIQDILNDKFDERIYKLLTNEDKRLVRRFIKSTKLDINVNDESEKEFQRQFEIVRGEFNSGNNSPQIKAALKQYVIEALRENKIARNEAYLLLYELSL
jgi:hypothetical protein